MKISLDMICLIFIFGMTMMIFVDDPLAIVMTANAVSENGYELTSSNTILHESFFNEDGPVKGNVVFDSDIGSEYLFESIKDSGSSTALRLINSMIEQPDLKYCAPTSVVCVFNAMKYHPNNIPPPPEYYYNENVAIKYWKVEAFIRHECVSKSVSYSGRTFGFSMDELIKIISCFLQGSDYDVKGYHAKEFKSLKDFETALSREVNKPGNYVIANICHALINESGGGHFSPIGAYHKGSSRFLFLDTARYKYPFVWVKTQDLFNSMNTIDPAENATRGYIVISKRANEKTLLRIETD